MKFKKNIIPVFTGIDNIRGLLDKIGETSRYHIASIKTGIPCLVANGFICDESGKPIDNVELQKKYEWFSVRVKNCKAVAICTIYSKNDIKSYRNTYNYSIYKYVYGAEFFKKMAGSLSLEVLDIAPIGAPDLSKKYRLKMMESISRNDELFNDDITMPQWIGSYDKTKEEIIDFVIDSSKNGNLVSFSDIESKYQYSYEGNVIPRYFNVDAFEIVSAKIETAKTSEIRGDSHHEEKVRVCDFLRVKLLGKTISLPMLNLSKFSSNRILGLFEKGIIDKIKFRCIIIDGIPSFPTPL